MKAIVTGANGFVGSHVVKRLLDENIEVLAISRSYKNPKLKENPGLKMLELDVKDIEKLCDMVTPNEYDLFYHFAWTGSAGNLRCDECVQTENALQTVRALRTAAKIGCKKFIVAGSIMEFEVNVAVYTDNTAPGLPYIYGAGKTLAHEICKPVANACGIDLIWAYITNAYGVGENSPRFINTTLRKIINHEKLEFTSGVQNYDFVYIDDVAEAFLRLGLSGKANKGYMIGSGNARALKEFILEMCKENNAGNPPIFGNVPFTGVNLPLSVYSTKTLEDDCGFRAKVSFAEGTKKTLEFLKEEQNAKVEF